MMLFEDGLEPDVARAMKALGSAPAMGIPYPLNATKDLALIQRIKEKHPRLAVDELVEKFLVWSLDVQFWEGQKTVRWRSRLWTWVNNDERYRKSGGAQPARQGRTHHVAPAGRDGEATEALDRW